MAPATEVSPASINAGIVLLVSFADAVGITELLLLEELSNDGGT